MKDYFFFNDTATTEIYTLSLHDALPISLIEEPGIFPNLSAWDNLHLKAIAQGVTHKGHENELLSLVGRSEEHTSELQSRQYLVCRLLLEKKKYKYLKISSLNNIPSIIYS